MRKYFDWVEGTDGKAISGASVLVLNYSDNLPASLFSDSAGTTPIANPVTTDTTGYYEFYVADGHYTIQITGGGLRADTTSDVAIYDEANLLAQAQAATTAATDAQQAVTDATAQVALAEGHANAASTSEANAASSATSAAASATTATTASAVLGAYPNAAKDNVPRGLTQASVGAITAGSGGTPGTYTVTSWSGGNFSVPPVATYTVNGSGQLSAFTLTIPSNAPGTGLYIGSAPSVPTPSFAASGLTGAAVALTAQFLVASGALYWVTSSDGIYLDAYRNVAGVATRDTSVASIPTTTNINDMQTRASTVGASGVYGDPLWRAPISSWNQTANTSAPFTKTISGSYTRLTPNVVTTDGNIYTHSTGITIGGYRTRLRQAVNAISILDNNANSKVGIMLDDGTTKIAFLVEAASGTMRKQVIGGAAETMGDITGSQFAAGQNIDIIFDILHATGEVQIGYSVNGGPRYWAGFSGLSMNGQTLYLCNYQKYTYEHRLELESIGKISTPRTASTDLQPWEKLVVRNPPSGWAPVHALPSDFRVYAINGKYASSYDSYACPLQVGDYCAVIYVDPVNGLDTNDGSSAKPLQSLQKAVRAGRYARKLLILAKPGNYNTRTLSFATEDLKGLVCAIVPWGTGRILSSSRFPGLVWTLNTGSTYQASLAGLAADTFVSAFDAANLTAVGDYSALTRRSSIALVDANPGSYFVSGGVIYVRTVDSRAPDSNLIVYDTFWGSLQYHVDGGVLYVEGVDQEGSSKGFFSMPPSPYTAKPTYVLKNCTGKYNAIDAVWCYSFGTTIAINCTWAANLGDGASFGSLDASGSHLLIETGVIGRNNGIGGADQNSTAHNASTTVRINGTYTGQAGQAVADVQDSWSWLLGCTGAKGSVTAEVFRTGNGVGGGHMWLEGCTATGGATDLVADNGCTIYKSGFTGTGTNGGSGTVTTYTP